MSRKIELEIEIDPDGNVRIETHGLAGEECLVETESLEQQLGAVGERTRKPEYYSNAPKTRVRSGTR
jgi:hypothetical protein